MNLAELNKVAEAMVAPGRGILAADESSGTIKKRFDAIGAECTEDSRRDYREMLFRANEAMSKGISGVILYDETIRQKGKDGTPLVKVIEKAGSLPGIKVDKGLQPLPFSPGEVITEGLDGLRQRLVEYLDRSGGRFQQPGGNIEQRRFPASGGPDDGDELAMGDRQPGLLHGRVDAVIGQPECHRRVHKRDRIWLYRIHRVPLSKFGRCLSG